MRSGPPTGLARRLVDPRVAALVTVPVVVLVLTWGLGRVTPGIPFLALFVVLAAGLWFGPVAGAIEGVYAAVVLGPWIGGVVVVGTRGGQGPWWGPPLFFAILGLAAGIATDRLRKRLAAEEAQRRELTRVHARTLITFANLVAHRDQPTAYHCERVAANVRSLGKLYGLRGNELNALYWAGMLHDLGKVTTPAAILLKDRSLTPEEYRIIQQHAAMGAEVLLDISPRFRPIAEGVRSHHERWDGSGYPDGLAGEAIPLFGRLLAVVDVFEAMTAPRPYRGPMPRDEVLEHLRKRSGSEFDPEIVHLFECLYQEGRIRTYADGQPAPADLATGIFSTGFWDAPDGDAARAEPDRVLAGTD